MDVTTEVEMTKLLREIRTLESDIESKQKYNIAYDHLVNTVNRKIKILEILLKKEA